MPVPARVARAHTGRPLQVAPCHGTDRDTGSGNGSRALRYADVGTQPEPPGPGHRPQGLEAPSSTSDCAATRGEARSEVLQIASVSGGGLAQVPTFDSDFVSIIRGMQPPAPKRVA